MNGSGPPARLEDRHDAGRRLAARLAPLRGEGPLILGLPRGGVVVAEEIARALEAPLDVLIVRKIGAPDNPEYGLGAVAEDGTRIVDDVRARRAGYPAQELDPIVDRELLEVHRRAIAYRDGRPAPHLEGRTVVLVDDGAATGGTMEVAVRAARRHSPRRIVVALGVVPPDVATSLRRDADDLIACVEPASLVAVGDWYREFGQVSDDEVRAALARSRGATP